MARKESVTKNMIIDTAFALVREEGMQNVTARKLAGKIGCSTQPIVWHFDNMEGLRRALAEYAQNYANNKMLATGNNVVEAFEHMGRAFVEIAVKEPNLYKFLYLDGSKGKAVHHFDAIITSEQNAETIKKIAEFLGIKEENVGRYLQNTMIYAHGIATLVATNVITATEEEMMLMINRAADAFLVQEGVPADQIPQ